MIRLSHDERRHKSISPHLRVYAWTPQGFLLSGLLDLVEDGDRQMAASFSYEPSYLAHPNAYPLDPINMPLVAGSKTTHSAVEVLGAIFDAAPDAWGRKVATAQLTVDEQAQIYRNTFLRGADGIGALLITPDIEHTSQSLQAIVDLSLQERPALSQVREAALAAQKFESTGEVPEQLRPLLAGSWTIGGARPKALLRDDRVNAPPGASVIAKFHSQRDQLNRNQLEWLGLRLAHNMGLRVPGHHLIDLGEIDADKGRVPGGPTTALLIERFDRTYRENQPPTRHHYVSAMSLVSRSPTSRMLDSHIDQLTFSWRKLMEVTSRVCAQPKVSQVEMYARLVFNAAISNSDDHLKNFGFIKTDQPLGYEVAPVFDVSPQGGERHYLYHPSMGQFQTAEEALIEHKLVGISTPAARQVREHLCAAFELRHHLFEQAGLSRQDRERAQSWIERGLGAGLAAATRHAPAAVALPETPHSHPRP